MIKIFKFDTQCAISENDLKRRLNVNHLEFPPLERKLFEIENIPKCYNSSLDLRHLNYHFTHSSFSLKL